MASVTSSAARKKARDHAAALLDAEDAERRRREQERKRRITEAAADIAGIDVEIEELTAKIEQLRADSGRLLASIVADGVSPEQAAAMTGRELRQVRAAVKATAGAGRPPAKAKPRVRVAAEKAAA
ncbi:MAG: hypothetical protein HOW97_03015 [Catenulispora sp.]|nr:hypothetical protein [Catenulispora sp.]